MVIRSMFSFLKNCQTVSQGVCSILHFYQQWIRVSLAPPFYLNLMLSAFQTLAILKVCTIVVFICISLVTYELNIISYAYLVRCLRQSLTNFLIGCSVFLLFCLPYLMFYVTTNPSPLYDQSSITRNYEEKSLCQSAYWEDRLCSLLILTYHFCQWFICCFPDPFPFPLPHLLNFVLSRWNWFPVNYIFRCPW